MNCHYSLELQVQFVYLLSGEYLLNAYVLYKSVENSSNVSSHTHTMLRIHHTGYISSHSGLADKA